jgi:hypothetical protein
MVRGSRFAVKSCEAIINGTGCEVGARSKKALTICKARTKKLV